MANHKKQPSQNLRPQLPAPLLQVLAGDIAPWEWRLPALQGNRSEAMPIGSVPKVRSGIQRGIGPQLPLTRLDQSQKVFQQQPDPWGLLGIPGGVQGKNGQRGSDLLKGQKGALKNLSGEGTSAQSAHGSEATANSVPPSIRQNYADPA